MAAQAGKLSTELVDIPVGKHPSKHSSRNPAAAGHAVPDF